MKIQHQPIDLMSLLLGGIKKEKTSTTDTNASSVFDQLFTNDQTKDIMPEQFLEQVFEKIKKALNGDLPVTEKNVENILEQVGIKGELKTEIMKKIKEVMDITPEEPVFIEEKKEEKPVKMEKKLNKTNEIPQEVVQDLSKEVVSLLLEIKKNEPTLTVPVKKEPDSIDIQTVTLTKPVEQTTVDEIKEWKQVLTIVNQVVKTEQEKPVQFVELEKIKKELKEVSKPEKVESKQEVKESDNLPNTMEIKSIATPSVGEVKTEPVKTVSVQELKTFVQKEMNTYADLKTVTPKKIILHLNPENLGKIEIQLEKKDDGTVMATLKVHETDALDVVEKAMEEAKKEFSDKGTIVDIQVTSTNDQQNKEEKRKEQQQTVPNDKKEIKDDETFDEMWQEQLGG